MMHDFPTPDDIFEELADKTAVQIDRLAPVAFDNAFRELVRYHRFLLALNTSRTPDGAPFSYAELTGDAWNAPHRQWIAQYRRLFERAMDQLPNDDHFIRSLSYAPSKLLPRPGDPELTPMLLTVFSIWDRSWFIGSRPGSRSARRFRCRKGRPRSLG